jgi:MoaA/NifB/PqqE/SkfB family radical SAM enzyme
MAGSVGFANTNAGERLRLAAFFGRLAVKERFAPRLHVRPLVAELFLTENCNLRCTSCQCWHEHTRQELTTDEWKAVIDQLRDERLLKLNFTGGEPLLRRDAESIVAHARDRGFRHLHLNTNGVLLDAPRLRDVLDVGIRSFNISVDGPDAATHEAVRGVDGAYDRTIEAIERLAALRREHALRLRMNFTVLRSNVATLPAMLRFAQELAVPLYLNLGTDTTFLFRDPVVTPEVHIDPAELDGALLEVDAILRASGRGLPRYAEFRYLRRHFDEIVQRDVPCAESQLKLMIHSTGGIGGCWGHDPHHNVRTHSIREVLDAPDYRDEHARLFRKDCVGCGSNYSLNLRWRPSTYLRDARWRIGIEHLGAPAR